MVYTLDRCRACGEPDSAHPSCCGAHPFGRHADTCPNRARELEADRHRDGPPDDCDTCQHIATAAFWCWKCHRRFDGAATFAWHPTRADHQPTPLPGVHAEFEQHRRECGPGSVVVPQRPA